MFYGVIEENYLYEFNLKEAKNVLVQRIKRAVLSFIDKIDNWLNKHKDSKVKSIIQGILKKVRKLLVKCDNIETESDAKGVIKDFEEYKSEFKENTEIKFEHVDMFIPDEDLNKIKNYFNDELDKRIESFKRYNDSTATKYNFKDIKDYFEVYLSAEYKMILSSIYNVLNRELLKTELYTTNPNAVRFKAGYYKKDVLKFLINQTDKLANNIKLKTYNGENIDEYLENFKNHIIDKVIALAHYCEANFNKMVKDAEIETYKELQRFK